MVIVNLLSAMSVAPTAPSGLWTWFILDVFKFVGAYGLAVMLFTFLLKLVLSPLDIYQRVAMKKNQRITERIKPELDKLKKQYANNPAALQKKQQEINKREGYSMMAGCLPMLVTLIISIWLLTELTGISQYKNMANYVEMYQEFTAAEYGSYSRAVTEDGTPVFLFEEDEGGNIISKTLNYAAFGIPVDEKGNPDETTGDWDGMNTREGIAKAEAKAAGQTAVAGAYEKNQESFLWVKNIWIADVFWEKSVMEENKFLGAVGKYATNPAKYFGVKKEADVSAGDKAEWTKMLADYSVVTESLRADTGRNQANGYLIFPILSIGIMLSSQILTRRIQKKSGVADPMAGMTGAGAGGGKMMTYIMPLMFGIFSLFYTTAFSLYMIVNSATMILVTLSAGGVMRLLDKREEKETVTDDGIIRIGRPDPNAPKSVSPPQTKKKK